MFWRIAANHAITAALAEGKAKGLEGAALEKHVRANGYPFGERAMHPYKIWCSEVKRVLAIDSGKRVPRCGKAPANSTATGQGSLFE